MSTAPMIVKADLTQEVFDPSRLVSSLRKAGAGEYTAEKIAEKITKTIVSGSTSKEIYARAFALLRKEARPMAARYALRRALFEFGPTGHPFEDFISHLFETEGWKVETRKMIRGICVTHEVDFYASHPDQKTFIAAELKYHNNPGYKTDLKVALYVKSRFDDIFSCDPTVRACPIDRGLLVTNTKFTSEAVAYAECAGVELLGWSYPEKDNLYERMIRAKVYPITTLTSLTHSEKQLLITNGIVAADQLLTKREALDALHLPSQKVGAVFAEIDGLFALPTPHDIVSV